MTRRSLPHDGLVFVGDGRKALFLRNKGDEMFPNFVMERVFIDDNPPTHDQGSDKPGRSFAGANATRRSAMEPTDYHEIEAHRFVERVCGLLESLVRDSHAPAIMIAAPPRALADLRRAMHADVKARVVREVDKDLTRLPVWEIEKHFVD